MFNLKLYRSILNLNTGSRLYSNANSDILPILTNRNPRNLEKMRIAYKPNGYYLEKPGRCYWHKLKLDVSQRHVTASVEHYLNGEVLTASTREWALKKQLYRTYDKAAFINVGRVLAQRCLEAGLTEIRCDIFPRTNDGKIAGLLDSLKNSGISLEEPDQFKPTRPWDIDRPEKPWETE